MPLQRLDLPSIESNYWLKPLFEMLCVRLQQVIDDVVADQLPPSPKTSRCIAVLQRFIEIIQAYQRKNNFSNAYLLVCQVYFYCIKDTDEHKKYRGGDACMIKIDLDLSGPIKDQLLLVCNIFMSQFQKNFNQSVQQLSSEDGVAIIHRVWLGSSPDEECLIRVANTNRNLERHWRVKGRVAHILWTNAPTLLAQKHSKLYGVFEIKDINELMVLADKVCDLNTRVRSYILWKQYSYACDILRILALYFYGGLYLDFTWVSDFIGTGFDATKNDVFSPKKSTDKIYKELSSERIIPFHFQHDKVTNDHLLTHELISRDKRSSAFMHVNHFVDNNILYSGAQESPFIREILENMVDTYENDKTQNSYGKILKLTHQSKLPHKTLIHKQLRKHFIPGRVITCAGILPAALRRMYFLASVIHLRIPDDNVFFVATDKEGNRLIRQLGLFKLQGLSWAKVDSKKQGSVEAPF
ncbi:hypothetical protein [Pelagibaculum spongiae]|uniref:GT44 domain-containing protein n=1 Tax=Pelagibaculum spongiae TaxID=2080658 RepID=A0A2V1H3G7_9GAMM|nr:hypothetical protein [Pelagibaculum spongiae]PVZ71727.1 hypothetical protein DC094_01490 [Pelagibaculum spongiae]